jgi:hypothetical protein
LTHAVLTGELDAAVVIEPPLSGQLTSVKIDEAPFYVVMSREDDLALEPALTIGQLAGKHWALFQRENHPPLYDLIRKLAQEIGIVPASLHHYMVPEETFPLLTSPNGIVIAPKPGALRIARDAFTMRPLIEPRLNMKTLLISRADNSSPALSDLERSFMRKINNLTVESQLSLPISV